MQSFARYVEVYTKRYRELQEKDFREINRRYFEVEEGETDLVVVNFRRRVKPGNRRKLIAQVRLDFPRVVKEPFPPLIEPRSDFL